MPDRLDFRKLRYVVAVAQTQSLTAAAKRLSITQPALTRCIAEVEEDLGVQLFVRLRRGVSITEEGEKLVARAQVILADLLDLEDDFRQGRTQSKRRLRMGVAPGTYHSLATEALTTFARANPDVDIVTASGRPKDVIPRLETGELDLVLSTTSYLEPWPDLPRQNLADLKFAYLVRKGHPAERVSRLSRDYMQRYPAVLPATVEWFHRDLELLHDELGLPPLKARYITDDFDLIFALLNSTDAHFPMMTSRRSMEKLAASFTLLPIERALPRHHLCVAFPKTRGVSPLVTEFVPELEASFKDETEGMKEP